MYEAFFGLQRRPFAATPDPQCWYAGGPYQAAIDELVVCAEQGQGIAILIAPAGAGKTILCERLVRELSPRFDTVILRHATFNTRRSLLQTLLCEMEQPFDKPTDQELRLGLAPVLRRLHQLGRALVLIVDEAHLLSESLLEELRILSDQAQEGKPLVRLILVGQPGLEEKLVHPSMQALNHRIRAQVALSTLSRQETADYLDYRLTWAGGRTDELFTADAVDLVCQAADGLPRCVNQLCDHALLLAYAAEKQPATALHITAALDDLKHLSLPWNPISERRSETTFDSDEFEVHFNRENEASAEPYTLHDAGTISGSTGVSPSHDETPPDVESRFLEAHDADFADEADDMIAEPMALLESAEPTSGLPVYRLSAQLDAAAGAVEEMVIFAAATPPAWDAGHIATPPSLKVPSPSTESTGFVEEIVLDRYTALDAGLTPPEIPPAPAIVEEHVELPPPMFTIRQSDAEIPLFSADEITWNTALARLSAADEVSERLEAVQDVLNATQRDGIEEVSTEDMLWASRGEELADLCPGGDRTAEEQLGTTVLEIMSDTQSEMAVDKSAPESAVFEFGGDDSQTTMPTTHRESPVAAEPRRYRHLFTMLRRKQQGRA